jgi:hypothetical protein
MAISLSMTHVGVEGEQGLSVASETRRGDMRGRTDYIVWRVAVESAEEDGLDRSIVGAAVRQCTGAGRFQA